MSGFDNTSYTVRSTTVATTLTNTDSVLLVSPTGGSIVITIPAPATVQPGRNYCVRRDATATNTVTLTPAAGLINGAANLVLAAGAISAAEIFSDGTNWFSLGTSA
jgi:hypothetical protein